MFSYFCHRQRLLNTTDIYITCQIISFQRTWKSEICEFDAPIHAQKNIIWLDVSVYDLIPVQVSDPQ